MKTLVLKNKNHILILKIILIALSLLPIILDLINISEAINKRNQYSLFMSLTSLDFIPIVLFISSLLADKKHLFTTALITLNIVYLINGLGIRIYLYYFITYSYSNELLASLTNQLMPLLQNGINIESIMNLIWITMIIAIFTMSIIILVKYSKKDCNAISLKILIPFIALCSLSFLILYSYSSISLLSFLLLYIVIVFYLAFYPKKFKKNNTGRLSQDVSLTELNDLYIIGKISKEQYYSERQRIIENI